MGRYSWIWIGFWVTAEKGEEPLILENYPARGLEEWLKLRPCWIWVGSSQTDFFEQQNILQIIQDKQKDLGLWSFWRSAT